MKKWLLILLLMAPLCAAASAQPRLEIFVDDIGKTHNLEEIDALFPPDADVTYFVIPARLDAETAKLLQGRKVGIHGYTHSDREFICDYLTAHTKVRQAEGIFRLYGLKPAAFRPPQDLITPEAAKAVNDLGYGVARPSTDYFFHNPRPNLTAFLLMPKVKLADHWRMSLHTPCLDEKTLSALRLLFST